MTPMYAIRPDLAITGIDWREVSRPAVVVRGDVLAHDFPESSFDAVVGISSIEHVGLGHYQGDPLDADGDRHCMERVVRWLKPGGWVYLDVPFNPEGYRVSGTAHREYDLAALTSRLLVPGLRERERWFCTDKTTETPQRLPPRHKGEDFWYVALLAMKES